jgi:hypothetical protein
MSLAAALGGVERRLVARSRARAATVAAIGLALPAWALAPGAVGAAAIAIGAASGAALARPPRGRAARWLDRHGANDDLMISGAAAADGRVTTALADEVVSAAGARARAARGPAWWPALASAAGVGGLALAVGLAADDGGAARRDAAGSAGSRVMTVAEEGGGGQDVDGDTAAAAGAGGRRRADGVVLIGGPREGRAGARTGAGPDPGAGSASGSGSGSSSVTGAGVGAGTPASAGTGAGTGAGAGDRAAVRPATPSGEAELAAAVAAGVIESSAPRAGAGADAVGVPARYRAVVAAYLAAAGGAR